MLGMFVEFEKSITKDRIVAGQQRARAAGARLGRPTLLAAATARVRTLLVVGYGIWEIACLTGVLPTKAPGGSPEIEPEKGAISGA